LDLASTTDFCSFRLLWRVEGRYYTWGRRWVPEAAVAQRTVRGTVPYASWVAAGYLEQTKGDVTDHDEVVRCVTEACERFNVVSLGYDQWNAAQVIAKLEPVVECLEVIQGPKTFHPAMQRFERAYISGNLEHGNDPVLTWCAANLVVRYDANLNMAPDKKRAGDKIDDMVALFMAFVAAGGEDDDEQFNDFLRAPLALKV